MKIKLSVVAIILGISILNAENGDGSIVVNMKKAIVKLIGDSQEHDFKINEQGLEIQRLKTEINELKNSLNVFYKKTYHDKTLSIKNIGFDYKTHYLHN